MDGELDLVSDCENCCRPFRSITCRYCCGPSKPASCSASVWRHFTSWDRRGESWWSWCFWC